MCGKIDPELLVGWVLRESYSSEENWTCGITSRKMVPV